MAAFLLLGGEVALAAPPQRQNQAPNRGVGNSKAWVEDFSSSQLNTRFWVIASGRAPGYIPNYHIGYYEPANVSILNGYLSMLLTQENGPVDSGYGTISHGALIYTKKKYGYGTYEWTMRMSSTATSPDGPGDSTSGSVSAGFNYVNNSETEIDFEFSGLDPETLYMVNWNNPDPTRDPTEEDRQYSFLYPFDVSGSFHTYRFVWEPGSISFYVDGALKAVHTEDVPSAPAYFMINHWGTDSPYWGGYATVGISRYFYIDRVSYTPLP
ncbi:MAG: glycoside hydrolase family 16 protein [Acidobacteria bacterium]|nr:glycoside hydrolase family 16 protein [Acidobacteriota bacterium]